MNIILLESDLWINSNVCKVLNSIFSDKKNVEIYPCINLKQAQNLILIKKIDVFIVNTDLQSESGIDFCRQLRDTKKHSLSWIILISHEFSKIREAIDLNFIDFFVYPINLKRFRKTVLKLSDADKTKNEIHKDKTLFIKYKGHCYKFYHSNIFFIESYCCCYPYFTMN